MRRTMAALAALAAAVPLLAGCGSGDGGSGAGAGTGSGTASGGSTTVDIVVKDGRVTPNGTRVKARTGSPVVLHIQSDTAGELHVHSSPEQEIEFGKGTSTKRLTIDRPGIVDVEDHALEQVVVQLQVS